MKKVKLLSMFLTLALTLLFTFISSTNINAEELEFERVVKELIKNEPIFIHSNGKIKKLNSDASELLTVSDEDTLISNKDQFLASKNYFGEYNRTSISIKSTSGEIIFTQDFEGILIPYEWSTNDEFLVLRNDPQSVGEGFITIIDIQNKGVVLSKLSVYTFFLKWENEILYYTSLNNKCIEEQCSKFLTVKTYNLFTRDEEEILEKKVDKYFISPKPFTFYKGKTYFDYISYDDKGAPKSFYNELKKGTIIPLNSDHESLYDDFKASFPEYSLIKYKNIRDDVFKVTISIDGISKVGIVGNLKNKLYFKIISDGSI